MILAVLKLMPYEEIFTLHNGQNGRFFLAENFCIHFLMHSAQKMCPQFNDVGVTKTSWQIMHLRSVSNLFIISPIFNYSKSDFSEFHDVEDSLVYGLDLSQVVLFH